MNYDRRYGWRGPIAKISIKNNWFARLNRVRQPVSIRGWRVAVVLYPHELSAELGFTTGPRYAAVRRNERRATSLNGANAAKRYQRSAKR